MRRAVALTLGALLVQSLATAPVALPHDWPELQPDLALNLTATH